MKKKVFFSVVAALIFNVSLFTVSSAHAAGPKAVVTPTNIDLGTIDEDVKTKATFTIKNEGDANLIIFDARPTCGCTIANLSSKTIAPGKTATLEAVYDSRNATGQVHKFINIATNDTKAGTIALSLTAVVKAKPAPDIAFSIYMLTSIQVPSGGSTQRSITVSNPGQMELTINEITASQGMQATIDGIKIPKGQTSKVSISLKPGESKKMDVTISPNMKKGNFQEVLTVRSNSKRNPVRMFIVQGLVQ